MQNEITSFQSLLNENGEITNPGWARKPYWQYDRREIKAPKHRIKEWDYYLVNNERCAAAFTISDLGYLGMVSVSFIDLINRREITKTCLVPMPMGSMGLRASSDSADVDFKNDALHLRFGKNGDRRRIQCEYKDFDGGQSLVCDFLMWQPDMDSMCIATPWEEEPKAFYYNQKINCMPTRGSLSIGETEFVFDSKESMAVLDWGRGVWTYDNVWYWGTCSAKIDGKAFGFNLGYGFSDRSSASENVVFYAGKAHKLGEVTFDIPKKADAKGKTLEAQYDFMANWGITSDDGRFEGVFVPILDRKALIDLKAVSSDQHQIFGHITGTVTLDDGRVLKMRDLVAAIEVVHNKY